MKRLYFFLGALTVMGMVNNSFAQVAPSYGVRAGLIMADWRGDAVQSLDKLVDVTNGMATAKSRTGFYAGGYMQLPLGPVLSLEPGIYYTQKGYTLRGDFAVKSLEFLGAGAIAQVQSGYIDVPVLLKASIAEGFQIFAGPQVSYLAHSNLQLDAGLLGISLFQRDLDITGNFNKWDVAMTGGIAYQFANGLNIQAGYEHGLTRVDAGGRFKSFNRGVKLGVGFSF